MTLADELAKQTPLEIVRAELTAKRMAAQQIVDCCDGALAGLREVFHAEAPAPLKRRRGRPRRTVQPEGDWQS